MPAPACRCADAAAGSSGHPWEKPVDCLRSALRAGRALRPTHAVRPVFLARTHRKLVVQSSCSRIWAAVDFVIQVAIAGVLFFEGGGGARQRAAFARPQRRCGQKVLETVLHLLLFIAAPLCQAWARRRGCAIGTDERHHRHGGAIRAALGLVAARGLRRTPRRGLRRVPAPRCAQTHRRSARHGHVRGIPPPPPCGVRTLRARSHFG